jgi:predicted RNase H-like HicB family nuclease
MKPRAKTSRPEKRIFNYSVLFIPAEEGGYTVEVPALEGVVTEGDSFEEAERNAKEAIEAYLETLAAHHLPIPDDRETVFKKISVVLTVRATS